MSNSNIADSYNFQACIAADQQFEPDVTVICKGLASITMRGQLNAAS